MKEYIGPEIITTLIRWGKAEKGCRCEGRIKYHQRIQSKCSKCSKISDQTYKSHRAHMLRRLKENSSYKYLCHHCASSKVFIEIFSGKTYEEIYGKEKALKIKKKLSDNNKRPMLGKPAPLGSGNGWSGWYEGWYFRSLRELSFMVNYIERFKFKWASLENKSKAISYINYKGDKRNYFADFLINDKYIIEIKPKKLWLSIDIQSKKKAAEAFCKKHNLIYKLIDPPVLSFEKILILYKKKILKWLPRYEEKFNLKYNI